VHRLWLADDAVRNPRRRTARISAVAEEHLWVGFGAVA
jgi:hypothetical protein